MGNPRFIALEHVPEVAGGFLAFAPVPTTLDVVLEGHREHSNHLLNFGPPTAPEPPIPQTTLDTVLEAVPPVASGFLAFDPMPTTLDIALESHQEPSSTFLLPGTGVLITNPFPFGPPCVDAATATIEFDISAILPRTLNLTTLVVIVNGVTAYDGGAGGFQVGWSGTITNTSAGLLDSRHVSIQPTGGFTPGLGVGVQVTVANDLAVSATEIWGFLACPLAPAPPTPFKVVLVAPIESNLLRAWLSQEPRHWTALAVDDATNRRNWAVSVVSGSGTAPVVEQIENPLPRPDFDPVNYPAAWSVDIRLDRRILAETVYLTVASGLVSAVGAALEPFPDDRDDHPGIVIPRRRPLLPAIPVRNSGIDIRYDTFEGRMVFDGRGDVDVQTGVDALKKRIIRRLISRPGGFFHLATYGVGLRTKELLRGTNLAELQLRVQAQVLEEDEIRAAEVTLAMLTENVLLVSIRAATTFGVGLDISFSVPDSGSIVVS